MLCDICTFQGRLASATEMTADPFVERVDQTVLPLVSGFPPTSGEEAFIERFHRRWFPRWFDGLELGVHSSSVQSTLHKFTRDGIPSIPSAQNWVEYKQEFARIVAERCTFSNGSDEKVCIAFDCE